MSSSVVVGKSALSCAAPAGTIKVVKVYSGEALPA